MKKSKKKKSLKTRNLIAKDLLLSGLYNKKIVEPKKGKGSYRRDNKIIDTE